MEDSMDCQDRELIEKIIADRKRAHGFYLLRSDVYRAFDKMQKTCAADGALSKMHRELVALGISIITDCESCMEWHTGQALQAGATPEQIVDVVGVAIEMAGGRATVSARFAMKALEYHSESGQ